MINCYEICNLLRETLLTTPCNGIIGNALYVSMSVCVSRNDLSQMLQLLLVGDAISYVRKKNY